MSQELRVGLTLSLKVVLTYTDYHLPEGRSHVSSTFAFPTVPAPRNAEYYVE